MSAPPPLARALFRALLPRHEIRDSLEGDLHDGFVRRAAVSPRRARWWYRRQVATLPYLSLGRAIRRACALERPVTVRTGGAWMGGIAMDLRVAARSLPRRRAFAGVAIATLALSVGAATLLFSVVNGVLLVPLPYEEPDRLVTVYGMNDEWRRDDNELLRRWWDVYTVSLAHVEAWRTAPGPLDGVGAYNARKLPLATGDGSAGEADAVMVDSGVFDVLGVRPALGRLPAPEEVRSAAAVAVLRHDTWMTRFGGDPGVLGRSFGFGDRTFTVIGVMAPGFFFPTEEMGDLWIPIPEEARGWGTLYGIARLARSATIDEASGFLDRVSRALGEDDPSKAGLGARAVSHLDNVVGQVRGGIQLLFGTALLVVLVACVNLGNLFLARSAGRREELAVRASLGAGTGSLALLVLAEGAVIAVLGGGLGVAAAALTIEPFVEALGTSVRGLPRQASVGLDGAVLLFALGATLATTFAAALTPALGAARRSPAAAIGNARRTGTSDGTRRGQRMLLGAQAALTVSLVSAAVLLGRSMVEAIQVDMGMDTGGVAVLEVRADRGRFEVDGELARVQEALRARLSSLPGVVSAGLAWSLPTQGGVLLLHVRPEGAPPEATASVRGVAVGEGYFTSLGVPVLSGRAIEHRDGTSAVPSVAVSESLATQLFGRTDVVGQRLLMGSGDDTSPMEIAGVVGETRQLSAMQEPAATVFYPLSGRTAWGFNVTLATEGVSPGFLGVARDAAIGVDPRLTVERATTLDAMLREGLRHIRMRMFLMASLAVVAAVLAMIGISGVVAHFLSEQTRDVGIRIALGAEARREVARVVRHALAPTGLGLAVGVVIALASSRLLESFLFGVEPTDPATYVLATGALLVAASLAAWIPARRTAAIDPARVLNRDG